MSFKATLRRLAPRSVRAHRILGGQLRGRTIVTSLHDYPAAIAGRTEEPLLGWFRHNIMPGETWLDVGAHYGYTSIALAELVGTNGHVYAFEPSITTAGYLNQTRKLNGLDQMTVLPFGLGDPGGLRMITTSIERGMANHALGGTSTENIWVVGFDHLWTALSAGPVHGIKIDVQGVEAQVLEGMRGTLREQHPKLVLEFHAGVNREQIVQLLRDAGYCLPGRPVDVLPSQSEPYEDDRSYAFEPT